VFQTSVRVKAPCSAYILVAAVSVLVGPQRGRSRSAGWQGERREGTAPHGEPHSLRGSQVLRLLRCGEPARVR
jgi:hypothetical protein